MPNQQQAALAAGNYTRVNGTTSEQTVTTGRTVVHEISVSDPAGGNAGTVTIKDGTTVVHVIEVSPGGNEKINPNVLFEDGLRITLSDSGIDVFAAYTD